MPSLGLKASPRQNQQLVSVLKDPPKPYKSVLSISSLSLGWEAQERNMPSRVGFGLSLAPSPVFLMAFASKGMKPHTSWGILPPGSQQSCLSCNCCLFSNL